MDLNGVIDLVRDKAKNVDVKDMKKLAVQVNLTGDKGGVFYVEIKDGKVNVEPKEYPDKSCAITISPEDFEKLLGGKLDPIMAFTSKKLKVDGDITKALDFSSLLKKLKK